MPTIESGDDPAGSSKNNDTNGVTRTFGRALPTFTEFNATMSYNKNPSAALPVPFALCLALLTGCAPGYDNGAPRAGDDRFRIENGETRNLLPADLLGNDSDPDGDPLRLTGVTEPAHGTLDPLPGGGYRYTNDGSNSTSDRFTYRIEDGKGGRASATVILEITPGPTARDDSRHTDEDTPVLIDVAANDTTAGSGPVTISSGDGSGITIVSAPANGTAEVVSGKVRYVPADDFSGSDDFTYVIRDSSGIPSNPATVTVTVQPVNDAPVANDDTATTLEDTAVTIPVLANDTDVDDGIVPTSVTPLSGPANGSVTVGGDGKMTYTPDSGFNGSDSLTYRVRDTAGAWSEPATVAIMVQAVNDPPVANADTADTGKNRPVVIDILANDSDPDGNGTIDRSAISVTQPNHGSVTVNGTTGKITYTPDSGFSGSDSFTYRLRDEGGLWSNVAGVTVQVTNAAPVALGRCSTTRQENPLTGTLRASDSDPGETLIFALGADGSAGTGPLTTANGGTVVITDSSTGAYTYTPRSGTGGRGKDTFAYQVTDGSGATATGTETVIVDLKIMPLGDSITSGQTDVGNGGVPGIPYRTGYRKPLATRLGNNGYGFDFVGSLDHGCNAGYDYDAEGWPGYTAQQIVDGGGIDISMCNGNIAPSFTGIYDALTDNPADIVLLHIGTNGISGTDAAEVATILDAIDLWEQDNDHTVTVIVAQIIDQWKRNCSGTLANCGNPEVATLNAGLVTMVEGRIASGDDVILVNQHDALTYPDDMGDGSTTLSYRLHPTAAGYEKMADVWLYPLIQQGDDRIVRTSAPGRLLDKCD